MSDLYQVPTGHMSPTQKLIVETLQHGCSMTRDAIIAKVAQKKLLTIKGFHTICTSLRDRLNMVGYAIETRIINGEASYRLHPL